MILDSILHRLSTPLSPAALLSAVAPRRRPGVAVIDSVRPNGAGAATITLRPGGGWAGHRAGQHVTLGVEVDGVLHHRCYSVTSPEGPAPTLEIAVADAPGGTVATHLVRQAAPGDVVRLGSVEGELTLDRAPAGPLLFLTGGSGLTPVVGMLRTLAADGADRDAVWIHFAPTAAELMFSRELVHLPRQLRRLRVEVVLTRQGGRRLDHDGLLGLAPDWRRRTAFACGPASLVDAAVDLWSAAGIGHRLHTESFSPPALAVPEGAIDAEVTLARSATTVDATAGTTLLDALEEAGHRPPSGCRAGLCHTCATPLLSGCARDLRNGAVVTPGAHVQLCVAGAAGDLTLDL